MAVSTTTWAYTNCHRSVVSASGTMTEVITEMTIGADSTASMQSVDDLFMSPILYKDKIIAAWWSPKYDSDWDQGKT